MAKGDFTLEQFRQGILDTVKRLGNKPGQSEPHIDETQLVYVREARSLAELMLAIGQLTKAEPDNYELKSALESTKDLINVQRRKG